MKRMASIGFGKFKKDMSMGGLAAPIAAPTTAAPTRSFSDGAGAGAGVRAHAGSFDGAGAGLAQSGSGLAAGSGAAGGGAGGGCRAHSGSSAMSWVGVTSYYSWVGSGGLPNQAAMQRGRRGRFLGTTTTRTKCVKRSRGRRSQAHALRKCLLVPYWTLAFEWRSRRGRRFDMSYLMSCIQVAR